MVDDFVAATASTSTANAEDFNPLINLPAKKQKVIFKMYRVAILLYKFFCFYL